MTKEARTYNGGNTVSIKFIYSPFITIQETNGVPIVAQQVKNPSSIHEDEGSIPGLAQWVKNLSLPQASA